MKQGPLLNPHLLQPVVLSVEVFFLGHVSLSDFCCHVFVSPWFVTGFPILCPCGVGGKKGRQQCRQHSAALTVGLHGVNAFFLPVPSPATAGRSLTAVT